MWIMGVKHGHAWGEDLSAGAGHDADENTAKAQTRYALLGLALRYRRLFSPWARVGDSTWGKFGGDLDLYTPGGEGAGRRRAPGSRDAGMGCVVPSRHRFGGKGLRGFQLRGLRAEKKQRVGRFFSLDGSRRRVGTMPGIEAIAID